MAERMAQACEMQLRRVGRKSSIERVEDDLASSPGASLTVWAETSSGGHLGADGAGARRRSAEAIGRSVASQLLADLGTGAAVDDHAADQLVLFGALADGTTLYLGPRPSEHLVTNLWLVERFGVATRLDGNRTQIEGLGLKP